VSTTSAIKRGLRAEGDSSRTGGQRERRGSTGDRRSNDRPSFDDRSNGRRQFDRPRKYERGSRDETPSNFAPRTSIGKKASFGERSSSGPAYQADAHAKPQRERYSGAFEPRGRTDTDGHSRDKPSFRERSSTGHSTDKRSVRERSKTEYSGDKPAFRERSSTGRSTDKPSFRERSTTGYTRDKPSFSGRSTTEYSRDKPSFRERSATGHSRDRPSFSERRSFPSSRSSDSSSAPRREFREREDGKRDGSPARVTRDRYQAPEAFPKTINPPASRSDEDQKLLGELIRARDKGTGPYKDVREDELAVRIEKVRGNLSKGKAKKENKNMLHEKAITIPEDDPTVLALKGKFKSVVDSLTELRELEDEEPTEAGALRETVETLHVKLQRIEDKVKHALEKAGHKGANIMPYLEAAVIEFFDEDSGDMCNLADTRPTNLSSSAVWIGNDKSEGNLHLVLSQTAEAIVANANEGEAGVVRKEKRRKDVEPTSRGSIQDQLDEQEVLEKIKMVGLRGHEDDYYEDGMPYSIPRTKADAVFLYGTNTVLAALRAKRRKFYALHFNTKLPSYESDTASEIRRLAARASIPCHPSASKSLLNAMSENRPHNGVVLEASVMPAPPTISLGKPAMEAGEVPLFTGHQSLEESSINGTATSIAVQSSAQTWRRPFVLMLDGILDPQNVGNILRTAYYYGVDAVAISTNTCCPLTSAALAKASSGACEAIQILALPKPGNFVYASKKAGWKIYAADAPPTGKDAAKHESGKDWISHATVSNQSPLEKDPVILMLGAEGEGLRENLKARADFFVGIAPVVKKGAVDVGVDSINVGTAAAVLVDSFLRKPMTLSTAKSQSLAGKKNNAAEAKGADIEGDTEADEPSKVWE